MEIKMKWYTDADKVDPSIIDDLIFENNTVYDFMNNDTRHFVIASKGIGKTLLLKYKRYELENKAETVGAPKGCIFIPESTPYLDFVTDFGSPSEALLNIMQDLTSNRRLWTISIMISALSFYHNIAKGALFFIDNELQLFEEKYKKKYKIYIDWCRGQRRVSPSFVLQNLLHLNKTGIEVFLDNYYFIIEELFKHIQSAVYIFIDRLDQALKICGKEVWINFQAGLIEASWDLMRINNHVKIYTSMRLEAWINYSSSDKEALSGSVSIVRYRNDDLKNILDQHFEFYEGVESLNSFLKFKRVLNTYSDAEEEVFNYIQRHTIGRPRDFVVICSRVSTVGKDIDERTFREVVNETAHTEIVKNIFEEISFLLHSINTVETQEKFLSLIPQNILRHKQLIDICRKFNQFDSCEDKNCKKCQGNHVFCDLYSAGLLGIVTRDITHPEALETYHQKFAGPYDSRDFDKGNLPVSENYYLIHPSLQNYIEESRNEHEGKRYEILKLVLVGHNYEWHEWYTYLVELHNITQSIENVQLKAEIQKIVNDSLTKRSRENKAKEVWENISKGVSYTADYSDKILKIYHLLDKVISFF